MVCGGVYVYTVLAMSRTYTDGEPYYCKSCGLGYAEYLACEDGSCELESWTDAEVRRINHQIPILRKILMVKNATPSDEAQAKRVEKAANFKRLAEKRVSKALSALKGVAALSNTGSYVYDKDQVAKILNALKAAVNNVESSYAKPVATAASEFSL